jgi:hypothetical protein
LCFRHPIYLSYQQVFQLVPAISYLGLHSLSHIPSWLLGKSECHTNGLHTPPINCCCTHFLGSQHIILVWNQRLQVQVSALTCSLVPAVVSWGASAWPIWLVDWRWVGGCLAWLHH